MKHRQRILIVEDSQTQALRLRLMLEEEGWQVACSPDAESALEAVQKEVPDLMVVDYHLPGFRGDELCRRIRNSAETGDLPILMLTAEKTEAVQLRGLKSGADDYVHKSVDPEVLLLRIRTLLRKAEVAALARELAQANEELREANRKLKETQTMLVQSEKMASLGQLVAGIAHEINNPLAFALNNLFTVSTNLEKLAPKIEPHLSQSFRAKWDKVQARLGDMKEGLERVKDLVLKLRTFSRLDEGDFKTVDIHESIDSVLMILHHKMKGRITVEKNYAAVPQLSCYAGELNQVLMNVIANAIDAIDGEGKITITTGQDKGVFFISVRDTGRGIPESIRHRIFDPFFTTKPVGQGMGLGLAIAYGVVQKHKGTIEVHTWEGGGTEFVIRIPMDLERTGEL